MARRPGRSRRVHAAQHEHEDGRGGGERAAARRADRLNAREKHIAAHRQGQQSAAERDQAVAASQADGRPASAGRQRGDVQSQRRQRHPHGVDDLRRQTLEGEPERIQVEREQQRCEQCQEGAHRGAQSPWSRRRRAGPRRRLDGEQQPAGHDEHATRAGHHGERLAQQGDGDQGREQGIGRGQRVGPRDPNPGHGTHDEHLAAADPNNHRHQDGQQIHQRHGHRLAPAAADGDDERERHRRGDRSHGGDWQRPVPRGERTQHHNAHRPREGGAQHQ